MPIGTRIKMGEGTIGRAAQTRQPVIIDDSPRWPGRSSELREYPDSTEIQIPMVYRGDLVGVLGAAVPTQMLQQNQEEMHLLNLFSE